MQLFYERSAVHPQIRNMLQIKIRKWACTQSALFVANGSSDNGIMVTIVVILSWC